MAREQVNCYKDKPLWTPHPPTLQYICAPPMPILYIYTLHNVYHTIGSEGGSGGGGPRLCGAACWLTGRGGVDWGRTPVVSPSAPGSGPTPTPAESTAGNREEGKAATSAPRFSRTTYYRQSVTETKSLVLQHMFSASNSTLKAHASLTTTWLSGVNKLHTASYILPKPYIE